MHRAPLICVKKKKLYIYQFATRYQQGNTCRFQQRYYTNPKLHDSEAHQLEKCMTRSNMKLIGIKGKNRSSFGHT